MSAVQVEKAEKSRQCKHAKILEIGENSVFGVCPLAAALGYFSQGKNKT